MGYKACCSDACVDNVASARLTYGLGHVTTGVVARSVRSRDDGRWRDSVIFYTPLDKCEPFVSNCEPLKWICERFTSNYCEPLKWNCGAFISDCKSMKWNFESFILNCEPLKWNYKPFISNCKRFRSLSEWVTSWKWWNFFNWGKEIKRWNLFGFSSHLSKGAWPTGVLDPLIKQRKKGHKKRIKGSR